MAGLMPEAGDSNSSSQRETMLWVNWSYHSGLAATTELAVVVLSELSAS